VPEIEECAHRGPDDGAPDVGADHDHPPRHPVADDAAEGEDRNLGERPGGEAEPDRGGAAAEVEDREGDGDRREIRPDVGNRARGEEQAEGGEAERALHVRIVPRYESVGKRARFPAHRSSPR
jgi:hypothetical protein